MGKIKEGYKVCIVAPNGEVVATIDLSGIRFALPIARADVIGDVKAAIDKLPTEET